MMALLGVSVARMHGWWIAVLLVLLGVPLVLLPTASAADSPPAPADVAIRIDTVPSDIFFELDGIWRVTPYAFVCLQDSVHYLNATNLSFDGDVRYAFTGWDDGVLSLSRSFACDIQQNFTALYETQYRLGFATFPNWLWLSVDGTQYLSPFDVWCAEGSSVQVDAFDQPEGPDTEHIFMNWSDGGAPGHSISCDGPGSFTASFVTQYAVMLLTAPAGLTVSFDNGSMPSPYTVWCRDGSSHIISVPSTQGFQGQQFSFTDWSDGGAQSHTIRCDGPAEYTAFFTAIPAPPTETTTTFVPVLAVIFVIVIVVFLLIVGAVLLARSSKRGGIVVAGLPSVPPMTIPSPYPGPGAGSARVCPRCGRGAEADWTYCAACGADLP